MSWGPYGGSFAADPWAGGGAAVGDNSGLSAAAPLPVIASRTAAVESGQLTARLLAPAAGRGLYVGRITVQFTGTGSPRAYVYAGEPVPANLVSGTRSGTFDECEYQVPLYVPQGQPLCVVWLSATGSALARVEYREA